MQNSHSFPDPSFQKKMPESVRILCLGDVVGNPGRQALKERLQILKQQYIVDLTIANGENSAGGIGITPATVKDMKAAGVDVITTGNHVWRHQAIYNVLNEAKDVVRPANFSPETPGKGVAFVEVPSHEGKKIQMAVINLIGRVYMAPAECPFQAVDVLLDSLPEDIQIIVVDFHAEASSEKRAMAHYLDGRVSAVFGTHTHVQTADAMILPEGTAQLTDLGMCGVEQNSVIGMKIKPVLQRFITGLPHPFSPASGQISLNGVLVDVDPVTGRALAMSLVRENV